MEDDPYEGLDNEERVYIGLHDAMMEMAAAKDRKGCFKLAAQLLTKANLPDLIRARCYMVLSQKRGPLSVQYAENAVSLIDNEVRALVPPEEFPTAQFELAHTLLRVAKEKAAAKSAQSEKATSPGTGESSRAGEPSGGSEGTPKTGSAGDAAASSLSSSTTTEHGSGIPQEPENPSDEPHDHEQSRPNSADSDSVSTAKTDYKGKGKAKQ